LVVTVAIILVAAMWLVTISASGPRSASAEALSPFPAEPSAGGRTASESGPAGWPSAGWEAVDTAAPRVRNRDVLEAGARALQDSIMLSQVDGGSDGNAILRLVNAPTWTADVDGDGELNEADIAAFEDLWEWSDPQADFNADGVVDTHDLADFVLAYDQRTETTPVRDVAVTIESRIEFSGGTVRANSESGSFRIEFVLPPRPAR
jgi:hypothetical protein